MHTRRKVYRLIRGFLILPVLLVGLIGTGDAQSASSLPAFCTNSFKLMPLGDSLTMGKYSGHNITPGYEIDDIGYRKDLKEMLVSGGYTVNMVGTLANGDDPPTQPFPDEQHEGHQGETDKYIADNVSGWLTARTPDVVLLHIGTNKPRDPDDVDRILDNIYAFDQDVVTIVARIIKKNGDTGITSYNNNVENKVENRAEFGSTLFMVDMENGAGIDYTTYPAGDMLADGIHLYKTGYTKMANIWMREIDKICENTPQLIHPGKQTSEEGEVVSLTIQISGSDGYTISFDESGLPPNLSINKINNSTGRITGTIQNGAHSSSPYNVTISISDDIGELDTIKFSWTIYETQHFYLPLAIYR